MLEPSVAVKQSAIEYAHSGRTLNRKEGSSHSFWSYCPATRLKQSNSSVTIAGCLQACCCCFVLFCFCPVVGTGEGGRDVSLCFSFILHLRRHISSICRDVPCMFSEDQSVLCFVNNLSKGNAWRQKNTARSHLRVELKEKQEPPNS